MRNLHLNSTALVTLSALVLATGQPMRASDPESELDTRIESSAKNSYNFKTYLKDDSIKVASSDGVVILTGTVSEDYHRALAEATVAGLPGVKSVNNQLTVVGDQPAELSDGWISMKVRTALLFHKNVSSAETEVRTEKGVVTLTGKADSPAQKDLTGEYTKDVEGVKEVHNELIVSNAARKHTETLGERIDDASITAQIKTTLLFRKSTHALATKVTTQSGVVTLHGEAKSAAERDLVSKLAEDIKGVKLVHNKMTLPKP